MSNQILPFAPTDTGTNLLSQSDYNAASDRTNGNQPGVASAKLVNKALRQATYVVSQVAQYFTNKNGTDVLDDGIPARLLAQINASMLSVPPVITRYLSGSGNHNLTYQFFIATGSATVGATYTNNSVTFTVSATVASGVQVLMTGNGAPTTSGALTKTGGSGDSSLTFYAMRAPISLKVKSVGAGGGGGGSSTTSAANAGAGGAGGNTTFGTSLITCPGGPGAAATGGGSSATTAPTINSPAIALVSVAGALGSSGTQIPNADFGVAAPGGSSVFAGYGQSGQSGAGGTAQANTGSGGGGGGTTSSTGDRQLGGAGAAGSYSEALVSSPSGAYAYAVGAGGTAGAAGTSGSNGGVGAAGIIIVEEIFQ